jgi:hypothetical protein
LVTANLARDMKSKNNLDYLDFAAEIEFNSDSMLFKGTIIHGLITEVFYGHSVNNLKKAYEQAVQLIARKDSLKSKVSDQLLTNSRLVESGEARLVVSSIESEFEIGVKVKHLLNMADGAAFSIQEQPQDLEV